MSVSCRVGWLVESCLSRSARCAGLLIRVLGARLAASKLTLELVGPFGCLAGLVGWSVDVGQLAGRLAC